MKITTADLRINYQQNEDEQEANKSLDTITKTVRRDY